MSEERPTGPAATLSGPVTTGKIIEPASIHPVDLSAHGYVEKEFFASGEASSYETVGPATDDGLWKVKKTGSAFYRTRIVVRRPADPRRFNGTVLVEWFNVTAGLEAAPDWTYLADEIVRSGYAYVGVSAQQLGVTGGTPLLGGPGEKTAGGLRTKEPERYGTLVHPGDQYSYDIFSQVAEALRRPGAVSALGPLHPKRIIAMGESQSAIFLTTYIDALQPVSHAFDGFFVHSRSAAGAPLSGEEVAVRSAKALRIRDDLDVPVFVFETETDLGPLLDYGPARQPDTDRFRTWEVAGTAHADLYQVGPAAPLLGCDFTINDGPQHYVAAAALAALDRWVVDGTAPPAPPPLELSSSNPPVVARNSLGIALGGVRTPAVDTPVATLSGYAPIGSNGLCVLFGQTVPFDAATLLRLYHDRAGYLSAYTRSLDEAIARGFVLPADRSQLLAQAESFQFPSA